MYTIKKFNEQYEVYELAEQATNSWFRIAPNRGGLVISWGVQGRELLYLDKATFANPESNVRGGIPVLFPVCGQVGEYDVDGQTYRMKNHGVARTRPWTVLSTDTHARAAISLRLVSDEVTLSEYPYAFELVFEYGLQNGQLTIDQTYRNLSGHPMPMYAGFHPYFLTQQKHLSYTVDAMRYLDYNDMQEKSFDGHLDLSSMPESALLLGLGEKRIAFELPDVKQTISLSFGDEFKYVVLWSVANQDFVCVEPWMAKSGAIHSGEDVLPIQPGGALQTRLTFSSISQ